MSRKQSNDDVIVIDSDDELDRKPAAKPSLAKPKQTNNNKTECISLLDSSDEEENPGLSDNFTSNSKRSKRKRPQESLNDTQSQTQSQLSTRSTNTELSDHELALQLQRNEQLGSQKSSAIDVDQYMSNSKEGKAWLAVQEIITLIKNAKEQFMTDRNGLKEYCVEPVMVDDMVFMATDMLDKQEEYVKAGVNGYIDTGYHYTKSQNLTKIRSHGLMTAAERSEKNVTSTIGGSYFGDGIYTANNGTNFKGFGDIGIIVCRLQGNVVRATGRLMPHQLNSKDSLVLKVDVNTVVGDKGATAGLRRGIGGMMGMGDSICNSEGWPIDPQFHEIVLRSSKQCLPAIRFDEKIRETKKGKEMIRYLKYSLQQIMDRRFNNGMKRVNLDDTPIVIPSRDVMNMPASIPPSNPAFAFPFPASSVAAASSHFGAPPHRSSAPPSFSLATLQATAKPRHQRKRPTHWGGFPGTHSSGGFASSSSAPPPFIGGSFGPFGGSSSSSDETLHYTAPRCLSKGVSTDATTAPPSTYDKNEECAICMEELKTNCVALKVCGHIFHSACIQQACKVKPQCPTCRKSIGNPQGKCPSGQMTISNSSTRCTGYAVDSIIISYNIPSAVQKSYHDNPGTRHSGKMETCYLPNNDEGQALLKRLKFAFLHGLTFTVGQSMTLGTSNCCTVSYLICAHDVFIHRSSFTDLFSCLVGFYSSQNITQWRS